MRYFSAAGFVVLAVVTVLGLGIGALIWNRYTMPYQETTRRLTYENSISHKEGTETMIASYCLNMRTASNPSDKKAFANFITTEASQFSGDLSPSAERCVHEAQSTGE